MYGTRTKEEHVPAYTSVYSGEYHPSKVIPAGYSGVIRGSIYREIDGMEMMDDEFLEQPADDLINFMEDDLTIGMYLFYKVSKHFSSHLTNDYTESATYEWDVNVSAKHGINISFFLPEKVRWLPNIKFQHNAVDYYIEYSESCSQEDDEDYDY
jgi:hypothetical protein